MIMVLQRLTADHRLTYGELSMVGHTFVTLEPPYPWQFVKVGRIPAGTYVARIEDDEIVIDDVPVDNPIKLTVANFVKESNGSPIVGMQRGAKGTVVYSQFAHDSIKELLEAHKDQENFLDIRDMP